MTAKRIPDTYDAAADARRERIERRANAVQVFECLLRDARDRLEDGDIDGDAFANEAHYQAVVLLDYLDAAEDTYDHALADIVARNASL